MTNFENQMEQIKAEVLRQFGPSAAIVSTHISDIRAGDTVYHDEKIKTVCANNISKDPLMGSMIFGDSYVLGRRPVALIKNLRS